MLLHHKPRGEGSMLTAGLDIGSRTIALVEWDGMQIVRKEVVFTGIDPLKKSQQLMAESTMSIRCDGIRTPPGFRKYAGKLRNYRNQGLCRGRAPAFSRRPDYPRYRRARQQSDPGQGGRRGG